MLQRTHCFCQARDFLPVDIRLVPSEGIDQVGGSRKPFLSLPSFHRDCEMHFCQSRRDDGMCQNNAQQAFVAWSPAAQVTELHKARRDADFLLDHLKGGGEGTTVVHVNVIENHARWNYINTDSLASRIFSPSLPNQLGGNNIWSLWIHTFTCWATQTQGKVFSTSPAPSLAWTTLPQQEIVMGQWIQFLANCKVWYKSIKSIKLYHTVKCDINQSINRFILFINRFSPIHLRMTEGTFCITAPIALGSSVSNWMIVQTLNKCNTCYFKSGASKPIYKAQCSVRRYGIKISLKCIAIPFYTLLVLKAFLILQPQDKKMEAFIQTTFCFFLLI